MKIQLRIAFFLLILSVAASAQRINPATGLPDDGTPLPKIDPATGLQRSELYDEWQKAKALMNQGQYEDSLDAFINYFQRSRFDQGQEGLRIIALGDWFELGRRYPGAKQALLELRDADTRKLLNGEGDFVYFCEVNLINQELGNAEASYTLFKAIEQRDPHLAAPCSGLIVDQLLEKGEYETCHKYMGDPETGFQHECDLYHMDVESQTRTAEIIQKTQQQMQQQMQEFYRQHPNIHPHTPMDDLERNEKMAKDRFVKKVQQIVEILVGTGDEADAEKIQKEAVAVLDDPRLETAVDDAKATVARTPQSAAVEITPATSLPDAGSPPPKINPAIGMPENGPALHLSPVVVASPSQAQIPLGSPPPFYLPPHRDPLEDRLGGSYALPGPGEKPDFNKILLQAEVLTRKGTNEDALRHFIWYYTHSETDPGQKGVRVSFAISDWLKLGDQYPKARQSLLEIRDEYEQRLLDGEGNAGLFQDVAAMNKYLESENDSYTLFKSIDQRDPKLARQCYYWVEDLLVQKREFVTCRKYVGDPQADYKRICKRYNQGLGSVHHAIAMRQRVPMPVMPPWLPQAPDPIPGLKKSVDDHFVNDIGNLVEILVATGSQPDAENIQKQALAVLNDPRLETAIDDAKARIARTP